MTRISIRHGPSLKLEAHAERTAVAILEYTGIRPDLEIGSRRQFTVSLDGEQIVGRGRWILPSGDKVVRALMHAMGNTSF